MSDGIAAPEGTTAAPAQPAPGSLLSSLAVQDPVAPPPSAPKAEGTTPAAAQPTGRWLDKLTDDALKNDPSLTTIEDETTLARNYVNLKKMLGQEKIPVPRDENDTAAWDMLYKAAGRPDTPDAYEIKRPADMPEGLTIDEEGEKFLKTFAHQNGWNQRQFDAAYNAFYEREAKARQAFTKSQADAKEEAMRSLHREGNAEETLTLAKATVTQYFDQEAIARLEQAGLGNDPIIIRSLAKIGKDLTGHQVLKGRGGETIKTMEQWQTDAQEYRSKHHAALIDSSHPDHKMRVAELQKMYERMYPETVA
jgi:hypothetical protein